MSIDSPWYTFTDAEIDKAPTSSGVYALYRTNSQDSAVIYYGRAEGTEGIKGRLKSHKAGYEGYCTTNAEYFNYEICWNPSVRERELLEEHKRIWGKLPRCNDVMP